MRDTTKHFPVNWIDGMKISKAHFIAQDDATRSALQDTAALHLSPVRYGVLPPAADGGETFTVRIALDNQHTLRASVLACQAVTPGGARIHIPAPGGAGSTGTDGQPATSFPFSAAGTEAAWWVVLTVNPFERVPGGAPDTTANPPRFPASLPAYTVQVVSDSQFKQYALHPYALTVGKVTVNGNDIRVEDEYIPPCYSVDAHPDLMALHSELDQYISGLEMRCSQIVQKIHRKSQQNELSDLVLFLCDRVMLFLGQATTELRWLLPYESPAKLFATVASLARVIKNTIDLRIGSGKEELMNYLSEWCEVNQGDLEGLMTTLAVMRYDHNDINKNILPVIRFVKVTGKLFTTLSNLEFIGKRRDTGIFVKEETTEPSFRQQQSGEKPKRRFFG